MTDVYLWLVERNAKIAKDELTKMKVMNGAQDSVLRLEMSTKIFAQKFLQLFVAGLRDFRFHDTLLQLGWLMAERTRSR
jgi:hypothetical protein